MQKKRVEFYFTKGELFENQARRAQTNEKKITCNSFIPVAAGTGSTHNETDKLAEVNCIIF